MQTPGRQIEAQTPMIESRGRNTLIERLSKAEEGIVDIERPQRRMFGTVTEKFEAIDNTFKDMQDIIKDDVSQRRKYFIEEQKILTEDSKNLSNLRNKLGRQLLGVAAGIAGLSQLAQGNVGAGASGVGAAAALFSPEILGVITSVVAGNLAKSGFLNRGGAQIGSKVAGASKLGNPVLISAALAASLILPGLINANQTADRRRQLAASRVIRRAETINEPDVDRFRNILARFDSILDNISLGEKKGVLNLGGIGDGLLDSAKESEDVRREEERLEDEKQEAKIIKTPKSSSTEDMFEFFGIPMPEDVQQMETETDQNISNITENTDVDLSSSNNIFNNRILKRQANNNITNNTNMNMIASNNPSALNLNLDILDDITSGEGGQGDGETNIIDMTTSNSTQNSEKKFTGLAAIPASVSVTTNSMNLDIDLIEHSDALRSWAAYA